MINIVIVVLLFCVACALAAHASVSSQKRWTANTDVALLAFAMIVVLLQLLVASSQRVKRTLREKYADIPSTDDLEDVWLRDMPAGMVLYISGFIAASYPGTGKVINNIAREDIQKQPDSEKNMFFRVDPAFSRKDGASMSANSITGPLSYQLGIKGDLSFSTLLVCQFTGITMSTSDVIIQRIYANTPDNNGFCIFMRNFNILSGNLISANMFVTFGSSPPFRCSQTATPGPIMLDTNKKYMIVATKGMGKLKVTIVDVGVHTVYDSQTILDVKLTLRESVVFSNREMMINNNENWNANIMAFGIFDRALEDTDVHNLYAHYNAVFRKMDPEYKAIMSTLKEVMDLKACPYDDATCNACVSVNDFSNPKNIIASSDQCLSSIDQYCTTHPGVTPCWCWDTSNPYYDSRCKAYRALFSNDPNKPGPYNTYQSAYQSTGTPMAGGGTGDMYNNNNNGLNTLLQYATTDTITDPSGKTSLMNSLLAALQKPGVGEAVSEVVSRVTSAASPQGAAVAGSGGVSSLRSKDPVHAMLTVLSDLRNTIPDNAPQVAAVGRIMDTLSSANSSTATNTGTSELRPLDLETEAQAKLEASAKADAKAHAEVMDEVEPKRGFLQWFFGM